MSDPLRDPAPLVRRVYAYAAYRLGDGPEAEDVTSETFERALRYRESFDEKKGAPAAWLVGIARRCVDDHLRARSQEIPTDDEALFDRASSPGPAETSPMRLDLAHAVQSLGPADRELVALRYGADLKAKDIAALLGQRTNTVEVALHRALDRLRLLLDQPPTRRAARATTTRPVSRERPD